MQKILILIFLFSLFSCSDVKYREVENSNVTKITDPTNYIFGSDDVPLFEDLAIVEEESANFDAASGNIAISLYQSESSLNEVKDFYMKTLPHIGFKLKSHDDKSEECSLSYVRNGDKLEISFAKKDDVLLVKFLISSN